jgi:hypothetical protein
MASPFGPIAPPPTTYSSEHGSGLFLLINNILLITVSAAGIFLIVQLILAGYMYISANGDVKKTEQAWAKIWQALIGFIIVALSFLVAAIIGKITGVNPLQPIIYGPGNEV